MTTQATSQNLSGPRCLREEDREFFERELASFLPDRIFDAHTHLWRERHAPFRIPGCTGDLGYEQYKSLMQDIHPGRQTSALFIGFAQPSDPQGAEVGNQWIANAVAKDPNCRGEFFVRPTDDAEWVRQEVRRLGLHGLKCYHTFSSQTPTWESDIPQYLPEAHVKVADEEGWCITLHIVKQRALADDSNTYWIRRYCETYPNMRLILAHSARGFQPGHNLVGLPKLSGLDNLYFDTSANCEPLAHQAIIRLLGHHKLMYGSDLPVSHMRGRSLGAADSFLWIYEETPVWGEKHLRIKPVLLGLEHLRSIKWACWSERLSDSQIEDIFWNNAARLFDL
jgi:glutamate-1-semialdehyde 2,1-aminomutase